MTSATTAKQLAAGQRRSLAAMGRKLVAMAAEWDDVDQYNMEALEDLADKAQETAEILTEELA